MGNQGLRVNIDSLKEVSKRLDSINNEIRENLSYIQREYSNLNDILETDASKRYQSRTIDYINETNQYINENNLYFINKLNEIIKLYSELDNSIYKSVGGDING